MTASTKIFLAPKLLKNFNSFKMYLKGLSEILFQIKTFIRCNYLALAL